MSYQYDEEEKDFEDGFDIMGEYDDSDDEFENEEESEEEDDYEDPDDRYH